MGQADWLRLDEISRLWSAESGRDAASLLTDLDDWFAEFTKESSIAHQLRENAPFDTVVANRLLGLLGARYLERRTLEIYCKDRGLATPAFWGEAPSLDPGRSNRYGGRRGAVPIPLAHSPETELRKLREDLATARRRCAVLEAEKRDLLNARRARRRDGVRDRGRHRTVIFVGLGVAVGALSAWGAAAWVQRPGLEPTLLAGTETEAPTDAVPEGFEHRNVDLSNLPSRERENDSDGDARTQTERLQSENARLTDQLAQARASLERLRTEGAAAGVAVVSDLRSDESVELRAELASARNRIADLEQALVAAAYQGEAVVNPVPEAPRAVAPSRALDLPAPAETELADHGAYGAEIEEVLTGAELPPEAGEIQTVALFDVVSSDDLLAAPDKFDGRQVVVTGTVLWLLRRYWLRADAGQDSMVVDVGRLRADQRAALEASVVKIETLARVRVRITGAVERRGPDSYRLAATELIVLE